MLEIIGLTKKYGCNYAINDISFSANEGEVIGLVGHNGCGKTTTMNIITGYIAPTSGIVKIDGIDCIANPDQGREKIGYLPETPALYPDLTVEEQLSFAARLRNITDRRVAIEQACEKADIGAVRNRLIKNLSKGYRQRVGLAQAFLGDPPLIVLDEPSNGLDPRQIAEMRDIIRKESKKHTILLSSHVLSEVEQLCDRLVILSNGIVSACGTISELQQMAGKDDSFMFSVDGVKDLHALHRMLEDAGCSVNDIRRSVPSLEAIFLQYTKDGRYDKKVK